MHPGSGLDRAEFWLRYERYPYLLAKLVTFVLVAYGLYAVLRAVQDVLTPVMVSLALAYLLDPAVDKFEARGFSRTTGILLCLTVGGLVIAAFLLFLWPTVAHLIAQITDGVPKLLELLQYRVIPWVEGTALPWIEWNTGLPVPLQLDDLTGQLGGVVETQLPGLLKSVGATVAQIWVRTGTIVASLLNLVLIPVLTFYFLRDFDRMRLAAADYLPAHNRDWVIDRIARMDQVVGAWFRGQVEVASILGVLYAIGLGLTFGLSGIGAVSGVAIGLLAGLLNVIPYFGFVIGIGLSVLLALLDWAGWWPLLGVGLTFAVVQALEGYVITPRIVGEKVGLSPVVVIVTLLIGGSLLGLLGVLLALPLAGAIGVLLPDVVAWYRQSDLYTGHVQTAPPTEPPIGSGVPALPAPQRALEAREPPIASATGAPAPPPGPAPAPAPGPAPEPTEAAVEAPTLEPPASAEPEPPPTAPEPPPTPPEEPPTPDPEKKS